MPQRRRSCSGPGQRRPNGKRVHAAALRCQIRIEPQRRRYSEQEEEQALRAVRRDAQWGNSLRPFLWTHVSSMVGRFDGDHGVRPASRVHL